MLVLSSKYIFRNKDRKTGLVVHLNRHVSLALLDLLALGDGDHQDAVPGEVTDHISWSGLGGECHKKL